MPVTTDIGNIINTMDDKLDDLQEHIEHIVSIFPQDSNETITFTAGAVANEWSAWANIVDNNGVTFVSILDLNAPAFLDLIIVETVSNNNEVYMFEVRDDAAIVTRGRFYGGAVPKQSIIVKSTEIQPVAAYVQYRMKCSVGGATCQLHLGHHPHTPD